jgi:quercetin dioxygenase-like cupin family protein
MKQEDFRELLKAEGYTKTLSITRQANEGLDTHSHPFEAKALVTQGSLSITVTKEQTYNVGDTFHLLANVPHTERYGPNGVTYLVGRK